jgi:hypothetical protein
MQENLDLLFNIERFMPHGHCFLWLPEILWMHVISDTVIAVSYYAIPLTILVLLAKRKQSVPYRWAFGMFGVFIFLCGTTHVAEIITLWYPIYFLEGLLKTITASVSFATALTVFPLAAELIERLPQKQQKDREVPA